MKRLAIKIYGRVQGVAFRYWAKQKAEELGANGFIKNEPDGSISAEAEGDEERVERFLEWCRHGPDFAEVGKVEFISLDNIKGYRDFTIKL